MIRTSLTKVQPYLELLNDIYLIHGHSHENK